MPATETIDTAAIADRCGYFAAPHAHVWEYTNGHLVCAFCDEKRPYPA